MSLEGNLAIAGSGLLNINRHLAVVAQNVANVGTPGYTRQVLPQSSMSAGGQGMGVRTAVAQRTIDLHLQQAALQQAATVAGLEARGTALATIDSVHGTTGAGDDLSSLLGRLQDSFSALAADPSSQPNQAQVVTAADALTHQIGELSTAYARQRQAAQDAVVEDVATLNATLAQIGTLSASIVQVRALGQSSADLENQRDAARGALAGLIDVRAMETPSGDLLLATPGGLSLPTRFAEPPFRVDAATLDAASFYPAGGVPAVTLGGTDVTSRLGTGRIGANLALRDTVLPGFQAELDEFAITLSHRLEAQGLRLFTGPGGTVPAGGGTPVQDGYVGYAGVIGVNPDVAADPTLVRDGTHAVPGDPAGASAFTPNSSGGPAGFATLVQRVLTYGFGAAAQDGVAQPAPQRTGLGPAGNLASPYAPPLALGDLATALVAAQARASNDAGGALDSARSLQSALDDKLGSATGVSVDQEMTLMLQLQSAYAANARVIAAVQTMLDQTLSMLK
jgi:flagellar hook-associated protein 1 FlgK